MFGDEPSYPARESATLLKAENKFRILELGDGQGRDSVFYAREAFDVTVLDYSDAGLREIQTKAGATGVGDGIRTPASVIRLQLGAL